MSETRDIKAAAAVLGRRGGSRRTPAKTRAARKNGLRGGRPPRVAKIKKAAHEAVEIWNEPVEFDLGQISERASRLKQAMRKLAEALRSAR